MVTIRTPAEIEVDSTSSLDGQRLENICQSSYDHIASLAVHSGDIALVRASDGKDNPQYIYAWFRDNLRVIDGLLALAEKFPNLRKDVSDLAQKIQRGLFEGLRKYESVMDAIIADPSKYNNEFCVPPRIVPETLGIVDPDTGKNILLGWTNQQEPQWLGELLHKSVSWGDVLRDNFGLCEKAALYLVAIDCFRKNFSNMWEDRPLDVYTSNVAASFLGLSTARILGVSIPDRYLEYGRELLNERIKNMRESPTRKYDLALFDLVNTYAVVPDELKDKFVTELILGLETLNGVRPELGLPRFGRDIYRGLDEPEHNTKTNTEANPSYWTLGIIEQADYYGREGVRDKYVRSLVGTINLRVNGKMPEQYSQDEKGIYVPRNPLPMAEGRFLVALSHLLSFHDKPQNKKSILYKA